MLKKIGLAAALLGLAAAPAYASCSEPIAPATIDGATATTEQIKAIQSDVMNFIHASDDYQNCLLADLDAQKIQATKDKKPLDPSIIEGVNAKVDANQKMKEKVGGEFNASVLAYKAKHPN